MNPVQSRHAPTPTPARGLRGASAALARRFFFDRQAAFWLAEVNAAWSLSEGRARVVEVINETPDVKTFVLAPNARWRGHRAGQHATVEVEIDGVRTQRCYSLSSRPGASRLAFTVKRVPGGRVSNWLHDTTRPGDVIGLGDAAGDFVLEDPSRPLLLLSGGSGATPVMSILRDLAARDAVRDVVYLHCARSRDDVVFRRELETLERSHPGLTLILRLDDDPREPGPLDEVRLRALVPGFAARDTMLCGPPGMMDAMEQVWSRAGASSRLRRERFVAASTPRAASTEATSAFVRLTRAGRSLHVAGQATLLEQLELAGERPAYGCRMGICQTCRCRKARGVVQNTVTGALSTDGDEDIQLCVSVPRSDLVLEL